MIYVMVNYVFYNPNPSGQCTQDCTVRAVCKAEDTDWYNVFSMFVRVCYEVCDIPGSLFVTNKVLCSLGYKRKHSDNITVEEFSKRHPTGTYIIHTKGHVVTVKDGKYYDSWNSGKKIVLDYWVKKKAP